MIALLSYYNNGAWVRYGSVNVIDRDRYCIREVEINSDLVTPELFMAYLVKVEIVDQSEELRIESVTESTNYDNNKITTFRLGPVPEQS